MISAKYKNLISGMDGKIARWLVVLVAAIHFFTLGFSWNHIDSFALLTIDFIHMVPQHAPLYPLLLASFRAVFSDYGAVLIGMVILQHMIFFLSAFQFLKSVQNSLIACVFLCLLYPLFIIQNGIYTEALFASFLLLLLSTAFRVYRKGSLTSSDQWMYLISILGLSLTRHVGILYAVMPILVTLSFRSVRFPRKLRIIALQTVFIAITAVSPTIIKSGFDTMDVAMYGRPGMHVIGKVFKESPGRRSTVMQKWMDNAVGDPDLLKAQEIIGATDPKKMWYEARTQIVDHLWVTSPKPDSLQIEIESERLMNQAFINMMMTGDVAVFKQILITFVKLALAPPTISGSLLLQDLESKESDLFEKWSVFRVAYPPILAVPILCLRVLFCSIHAVFSLAMLVLIVVGFVKRRFSAFSIFLLLMFVAQLAAHAIFTIAVARYSIHLELTLFFILLDMMGLAGTTHQPIIALRTPHKNQSAE